MYRAAEDDCKETGNETNYYGAVKLQYCETDGEMECVLKDSEGRLVPDPATSPAYAGCYTRDIPGSQFFR